MHKSVMHLAAALVLAGLCGIAGAEGLKSNDPALSKEQQELLGQLEAAFGGDVFTKEGAGKVVNVTGTARAVAADGSSRELKKGDSLKSGETLVTEQGGSVAVVTPDLAKYKLDAETELKLTEYTFDPNKAGGDKSEVELKKGAFAFESGVMGKRNPDRVAYHTGFGTIGLRGTRGKIAQTDDGGSFIVTEGAFTQNGQTYQAGQFVTSSGGQTTVVDFGSGSPATNVTTALNSLPTEQRANMAGAILQVAGASGAEPASLVGAAIGALGTDNAGAVVATLMAQARGNPADNAQAIFNAAVAAGGDPVQVAASIRNQLPPGQQRQFNNALAEQGVDVEAVDDAQGAEPMDAGVEDVDDSMGNDAGQNNNANDNGGLGNEDGDDNTDQQDDGTQGDNTGDQGGDTGSGDDGFGINYTDSDNQNADNQQEDQDQDPPGGGSNCPASPSDPDCLQQ